MLVRGDKGWEGAEGHAWQRPGETLRVGARTECGMAQ